MDALRLDKWLWAARFFRTRSQAKAAVERGQVRVNGIRSKPAKDLKTGDTLSIRRGFREVAVEVTALTDRRGNAQAAALLYSELALPSQQRDANTAPLENADARHPAHTRRPTKKGRRQLRRLKAGGALP